MKKTGVILAVLLLAASSAVTAADFNVEIKTDNRIYMNKPLNNPDYGFYFNRNELTLKAQQSMDSVKGYAEIGLLNSNIPQVITPSDTLSDVKIQPFEMRLNEAYVTFFKIFYEGLDITFGRQIIAWGTADKLNQLSVINPYDYSDMLDFGKRLGSNAVRANLTIGGLTAEAVYVPVFSPAVMTDTIDLDAAAKAGIIAKTGVITGYTSSVELPAATAENASYGARVGAKVLDYDLHLEYYYGLYNTAVNKTDVDLVYTGYSLSGVNGKLTQIYPRVHVIGCDMAGSFFGAGVWAELAAVVPRQVISQDITSPLGTQNTILLNEKPYYKYTVGTDYTFGDGTYMNIQFMHGFFTELGDNLSDLAMARVEKGIMEDKVKVKLEGGLEFDFNKDRNVTPGALVMPGITYKPYDSTEIELTGLKVFANNKNDGRYHFVSVFDGLDQIILRAKYTF